MPKNKYSKMKAFVMWNCEHCESSNSDGDIVCRICGHSKSEEAIAAPSKELSVDGTSQKIPIKKSCFGIGVSSTIIALCIVILIGAAIIVAMSSGGQSTIPTKTIGNTASAPYDLNATDTPRMTITQPTKIKSTKTPIGSNFASYSCPDKSQIKLNTGSRAFVSFDYVNLRSSPVVPDVWDANIVVTLQKGDKMTIVGGPKCAYDGTWWEVQTDNGYTGWVREMQPNKILLEPIR